MYFQLWLWLSWKCFEDRYLVLDTQSSLSISTLSYVCLWYTELMQHLINWSCSCDLHEELEERSNYGVRNFIITEYMGSTAGNFKELWDDGGRNKRHCIHLQDMLFMCWLIPHNSFRVLVRISLLHPAFQRNLKW